MHQEASAKPNKGSGAKAAKGNDASVLGPVLGRLMVDMAVKLGVRSASLSGGAGDTTGFSSAHGSTHRDNGATWPFSNHRLTHSANC